MEPVLVQDRVQARGMLEQLYILVVAQLRHVEKSDQFSHLVFAVEAVYIPGDLENSPFYRDLVNDIAESVRALTADQYRLRSLHREGGDVTVVSSDHIWESVAKLLDKEEPKDHVRGGDFDTGEIMLLCEKHKPVAPRKAIILPTTGYSNLIDLGVWTVVSMTTIENSDSLIKVAKQGGFEMMESVDQLVEYQNWIKLEGIFH